MSKDLRLLVGRALSPHISTALNQGKSLQTAFTARAFVHIGAKLMQLMAVVQVTLFFGVFPQFAYLLV